MAVSGKAVGRTVCQSDESARLASPRFGSASLGSDLLGSARLGSAWLISVRFDLLAHQEAVQEAPKVHVLIGSFEMLIC